MEKIKRSALVPYSAEKMFRLVNSVEEYPKFVPYCVDAMISSQTETEICATLKVSKSGIAKSFSTKNSLVTNEKINMELIDGPFKYLKGSWNFKSLSEEACKIELDLEYEFAHKLTSIAFAKIFSQLTQSMVTAFTTRATQVYG